MNKARQGKKKRRRERKVLPFLTIVDIRTKQHSLNSEMDGTTARERL
jgi:hypothetical protein